MYVKTAMDKLKKQSLLSAGLDYPGVSPMHCFLKDAKQS